jgi:hypothetical protein
MLVLLVALICLAGLFCCLWMDSGKWGGCCCSFDLVTGKLSRSLLFDTVIIVVSWFWPWYTGTSRYQWCEVRPTSGVCWVVVSGMLSGSGILLAGMIKLGHVCCCLFFYTVWVPLTRLPLCSGTVLVDAFYSVLSLCNSICFSFALLVIACLVSCSAKTLSWLELLNDDCWIVLK